MSDALQQLEALAPTLLRLVEERVEGLLPLPENVMRQFEDWNRLISELLSAMAREAQELGVEPPTWTDRDGFRRAQRHLEELRAVAPRRKRWESLARQLQAGRFLHRLQKKQQELENLRSTAAAEVARAASETPTDDLPGPTDGTDWLTWAWGQEGEFLETVVNRLADPAPALARLLSDAHLSWWQPAVESREEPLDPIALPQSQQTPAVGEIGATPGASPAMARAAGCNQAGPSQPDEEAKGHTASQGPLLSEASGPLPVTPASEATAHLLCGSGSDGSGLANQVTGADPHAQAQSPPGLEHFPTSQAPAQLQLEGAEDGGNESAAKGEEEAPGPPPEVQTIEDLPLEVKSFQVFQQRYWIDPRSARCMAAPWSRRDQFSLRLREALDRALSRALTDFVGHLGFAWVFLKALEELDEPAIRPRTLMDLSAIWTEPTRTGQGRDPSRVERIRQALEGLGDAADLRLMLVLEAMRPTKEDMLSREEESRAFDRAQFQESPLPAFIRELLHFHSQSEADPFVRIRAELSKAPAPTIDHAALVKLNFRMHL